MTAPTISGFTTNFAYTENVGAVLIDTDVTLADAEGNWIGGTIVVSGLGASEDIAIADEGTGTGQFFVTGGAIFLQTDIGGGVVIPVAIATIADAGTSFTITFAANVSTEVVERVLEHLTYSNTSDAPAPTERFTVTVTDGAGEIAVGTDFTERPDALDPFNGVTSGASPYAALVDWDGDGDRDVVATGFGGGTWNFSYFRNNGDGTLTRLTGAANPFGGITGTFTPAPAFGDIDGDGDIDMVVGQSDGTFRTWLRGAGGSLTEAAGASNPFSGFDVGNFASAALGDIDGDTDLDLVSGATSGTFSVFRNNGGLSFTQLAGAANPLNGIDIGTFSNPGLGDFDGDGDMDLVAGEDGGALFYFRKDPSGFVQQTGAANPFDGVSVPTLSTPAPGDFDGDGDVDLIVGSEFNGFIWLEHNGGEVTVAITAVDDAAVAQDDAVSTTENAVGTGSLFADNGSGVDNDPDGPALSIAEVNGQAANVGTQIALASGALLTVNADGTYSYDPDGAFDYLVSAATAVLRGAFNDSATDSFTYTLANGNTATVTVTINGVDGAGDELWGNSGNNTITGTPGIDYFDLSQGGDDSASGDASNDAFYFGAAFTAADTVDGGAGDNDQIGLEGDYTGGNALTLGAGPGSVTNVEVIALLAGFDYDITVLDAAVPAGATLKVFSTGLGAGDDFTFDGSAEASGSLMVYGGAGTDLITTGGGNDGVYFGPGRFDPLVDRVNGGAGTDDQMALDGDYTLTLDSTSIQNIDVLALLRGKPADLADYDITIDDTLVGVGETFTVWGTPVQTSLIVDGSGETDGHLRIYGGSANDALSGGDGNDWIWGGLGADTLEGGDGADTFYYENVAQSSANNVDTLIGIDATIDRIDLPFTVTGFASGIADALDFATLEVDLQGSVAVLGNHQAVLFTANAGDMNGRTFLIVDANGTAGYQHGSDFLIEVNTAAPIEQLGLFV